MSTQTQIILLSVALGLIAFTPIISAQMSKRSDSLIESGFNFLDEEICLTKFDVSEGSIIRTKDSLALGAKYINVSEFGDRKGKEECVRLCCKIPNCNVVTFEEKKGGSCYMFNCGSMQNFLCKFTNQAEFMSAILRKRIDPVMETQERPTQNKHEAELSQLRNKDSKIVTSHAINSPSNSERNGNSVRKETLSNGTFSLDNDNFFNKESRRCSRYQFECKSTGECIGIYNACDGIPQCDDGSDEAVELNCPSLNGHPSVPQVVKEKEIGSSAVQKIQSSERSSDISGLASKFPPEQPHHSQDINAAHPQPQEFSTLSRALGSNYVKNGVEPPNPNIFNHKDGSLIEDPYGNQLQQQRQNPFNYWKSYDYGPEGNYGNRGQNYAQGQSFPFYGNQGPQGSPNYGTNQFKFPMYGDIQVPMYNNPYPDSPPQQQLLPIPPQPPQYFNPNGIGTKPNLFPKGGDTGTVPPNQINGAGSQTIKIPEKTTTLKPSFPVTASPAPTTTTPSHLEGSIKINSKKIEEQILQKLLAKESLPLPQLSAINDQLLVEARDTPSPGAGAVLAFITGVGMSIAMIFMLTCRFRRIRMSSRRRGKNRLDPDYLVDGMYL